MGLKFDHSKKNKVTKMLRGMANRAEDVTPAWPRVGAYMSRQVRRQFGTRGKHFGTTWVPLARSTVKQKKRLGYPRSPLVRTGDLKKSFVGRPMNIEVYTPKTATFGSSLRTAGWQQHGTRRDGKRHIPPRIILKIGQTQKDEIREIIKKHILPKTRKKKAK